MSENKEPAKLDLGDGEILELARISGTQGPDVLDVTSLYKKKKVFTYDPGFLSTASCESKITFINGQEGILRYRGYDIADLTNNCNFLEVSYLLLHGELPDKKEFADFDKKIRYHSMVHEQLQFLLRGFPRDAHPMSVLCGAFSSLSAFYHDSIDINCPEQRYKSALRMIAKIPTLVSWAFKYSFNMPFMYPQTKYDYAENFLYMMFANPCEEYKISPVLAKAMHKIFILHADHEQNASTSTVRLAASSGANPFACVSAGVASLWGPAHGGANEAVIKMLSEIGSKNNIKSYIEKVKDPKSEIRLMGFGHRVYKNYDPRAAVLKETAHEVLKDLGKENDPYLEIAQELERIALNDSYFIERKLFPNVDFYSGIIYRAMRIPPAMFTALFALARTSGWVSQWLEMSNDPKNRIGRPRQLYTGEKHREFVNIKNR